MSTSRGGASSISLFSLFERRGTRKRKAPHPRPGASGPLFHSSPTSAENETLGQAGPHHLEQREAGVS